MFTRFRADSRRVRSHAFAASIFGLTAFFLTAGCDRGPSVTSQRSYVVDVFLATEKLTDAGEQFGMAMEPWFLGNELDPVVADAALENYRTTMREVRDCLERRIVPDDDRCKQFAMNALKYVEFQESLGTRIDAWVATAKAENPASVETRRNVAEELYQLNERELEWKRTLQDLAAEIGVIADSDSD